MNAIAHAAACLAIATGAFAAAAADAPPRLDAGNWRVRVSSVTNGVADPAQDFEVCLRDELKDLAAYLRCTGTGFTYNAETRVIIEKPQRFTLTIRSEAKTAKETGIVSAAGEGDLLVPCEAS